MNLPGGLQRDLVSLSALASRPQALPDRPLPLHNSGPHAQHGWQESFLIARGQTAKMGLTSSVTGGVHRHGVLENPCRLAIFRHASTCPGVEVLIEDGDHPNAFMHRYHHQCAADLWSRRAAAQVQDPN